MTAQICKDLSWTLSRRVMQIAMDHTDMRYDLSLAEVQGILLTSAITLLRMASALEAGKDGITDPEAAWASGEHYLSMLALLTSKEMANATNS